MRLRMCVCVRMRVHVSPQVDLRVRIYTLIDVKC